MRNDTVLRTRPAAWPGRGWLAVALALAGLTGPARGASYCVSTPAQLNTAFASAAASAEADVVQLVQGTYVGSFLYQGNSGLSVLGGYAPGCGSRVLDPVNTVVDAVTAGYGLRLYSLGAAAFTVEGLTVRNGRALSTTDPSTMNGGGLWVVTQDGSLVVNRVTATANRAYQDGGGVYVYGTRATVRSSTVTSNLAGFGAGLYFTDCKSVAIESTTVDGNQAAFAGGSPPGDGGGVYVDATFPNSGSSGSTSVRLLDNVLSNNTAAATGGGVFVYNSASGAATTQLFARGNTLQGNGAASGAGFGVSYGPGASLTLTGNTFRTNTASSTGGGVAAFWVRSLALSSNLFQGNAAGNGGGAYLIEPLGTTPVAADTWTVTNNTLVGNGAGAGGYGGGLWIGLRDDADAALLHNNVFWANSAGSGAAADLAVNRNYDGSGANSQLQLLDNDLDQSVAGTFITPPGFGFDASNLNKVNPSFVNAGAGDYHLTAGSACRDSGSSSAPGLPAYDRDQAFRLAGAQVDMGAYEYGALPFHRRHQLDFDRDERSDFVVFHRASGTWYTRTAAGATSALVFGGPDYQPVARDYDGDGQTDVAAFHPATGLWFILSSATGATTSTSFGGSAYTPVPADYDGDGKADLAVYHAASGLWFVRQSTNGATVATGYGGSGYAPVPEDFDGDGKADLAVYHDATGLWFVRQSTNGVTVATGYGASGYTPLPRDYDGDGKADLAVFHPPTGLWFLKDSSTGASRAFGFGASGYAPAPGDFDGDGRADATVYHTASGLWFVRQSQSGAVLSLGWGGTGFEPQQ